MSYVEVAPETAPALLGGLVAPHEGPLLMKPPAPEGAGVGGGASLGTVNSISDTVLFLPSDIARDALLELHNLPTSHPDRQYIPRCNEFVDNLIKCEQKGFMIKGYDTKAGKLLNLPISYNNRWGPVRRKELSWKLDLLEHWFDIWKGRPVTMISLTGYQTGETIAGAWYNLNKARTKLLKILRKYFNSPDYFWVVEPHKSGYVHYHLAVFADVSNNVKDNKGQGLEDKLRYLWSKVYKAGSHTYGLEFSHKTGDDSIKGLKDYLTKYLRKGFLLDKWSIGLLLFNAHLWDTGFRTYGASKNISSIMKISDEKDSSMVWIETRMKTTELTPEGNEVEIDKQIWDRQYFPDWIDEPLWYGNGRQIPSDLSYEEKRKSGVRYYNWGRKVLGIGRTEQIQYKETSWRDLNFNHRKHTVPTYPEDFTTI